MKKRRVEKMGVVTAVFEIIDEEKKNVDIFCKNHQSDFFFRVTYVGFFLNLDMLQSKECSSIKKIEKNRLTIKFFVQRRSKSKGYENGVFGPRFGGEGG